jgi:hypothetical protein
LAVWKTAPAAVFLTLPEGGATLPSQTLRQATTRPRSLREGDVGAATATSRGTTSLFRRWTSLPWTGLSHRTRFGRHFASSPCSLGLSATLFAWFISHQLTVLFSHNKPATSNQPAVFFSQNKPAPAISHQPTEQAACHKTRPQARAASRGTSSKLVGI